jgi:hypothetical protein
MKHNRTEFKSQKNFETPLENNVAKIISREFKHLEESLTFQYEMLDAQSSRAECYGDHLRHKFISPFLLGMLFLKFFLLLRWYHEIHQIALQLPLVHLFLHHCLK